jgi:transcriptional regulator with XRE-family HTH domain
MPRSLKIHPQYIPTLKSSLLRNGFPSQKILAEDLGIAQSTVSNFLNGKPVDYANFLEICEALGQEWRNIADLSDLSSDSSRICYRSRNLQRPPATAFVEFRQIS